MRVRSRRSHVQRAAMTASTQQSDVFMLLFSEDYLTGVVSVLSLVSRTKTASSFAGSVLLALRLIA